MTQFWRRGFWRRSVYGVPHWVEGHRVDRDEWARGGTTDFGSGYFRERLRSIDADRGATSTFVVPNAHCPVCGAAVFFYQNEFGSRVFFDELGPPWPKHPCTDQGATEDREHAAKRSPEIPPLRANDEIGVIDSWLGHAGLDPRQEFFARYGLSQWSPFRVVAQLKASEDTLLVLDPMGGVGRRMYLEVTRRLARSLGVGALVFFFRGWISYFDLKSMSSAEHEVRRLPGASAFVEAVIKSQSGA